MKNWKKQHCLTSHFSCFQSTPVRLRVFEAIYSKTESPINWTILWLRTQDNSQQINNKKNFLLSAAFRPFSVRCEVSAESTIAIRPTKFFFSLFYLLTCIHSTYKYTHWFSVCACVSVDVLDCHVPCSFDICQNSREIYMYCVCAVIVCVCVKRWNWIWANWISLCSVFFFFSQYSNCNVTNVFFYPKRCSKAIKNKNQAQFIKCVSILSI